VRIYLLNSERSNTPIVQKESLGFPFLLICAYMFVDYLRPQDLLPFLERFHLGAVISIVLGLTLFIKRKMRLSNPHTILFIMFLLVMAKNIPIAVNNYWAFQTTWLMLMIFVLYYLYLVAFLDSTTKIRAFLYFVVAMHILLSLLAIRSHGRGVGNFLKDENDFSLAINMVIPYVLFLVQEKSGSVLKRVSLLAAIGLFVLINVVSSSRGGFLGMLAVVLFFLVMQERKLKMGVLMIVLGLAFLLFLPGEYKMRVQTIDRRNVSGWDTGDTRLYFWGMAWDMFLDHPILGVGPGNYPWNVQYYETVDEEHSMLAASRGGRPCHSLYFTLLAELGIPGVLVFGLMVFRNMGYLGSTKRLMKSRSIQNDGIIQLTHEEVNLLEGTHLVNKIMVGSMIGYLVSGAFISVLYYPHFWILSAVMVASMRNFEEKLSRERG
jgi:O-antigen ligase